MKPMILAAWRAAHSPLVLSLASLPALAAEVLPSWNDGVAKARILAFVRAVTEPGGKDFVPPAERIAVFDNDGTLWSEQPMYFQLAFAIDRVRALAPQHPEWQTKQPFKAALQGDLKALAASGEKGLLELVMATHAGNTSEQFAQAVRDWVKTARHPGLQRPYTELTFQPMRELLDHLRANGFKTWIVSGGGVEFLRVVSEALYGVPPEQVIGSSVQTKYELRNGLPVIVRLPTIDFIDDKAGKPVGIHKTIGRRPIAALGNSDGDFQMLEWTTSAPGARLGVIVHHDDAEREFAYDRQSHVGRLERALDEAGARGWTVLSIRQDWKQVFPSR
ncbi:MAG: haloacid dehalogenase-like hydrolase [Betaproteobacteria bacterium]|nr:haloacid dehalogenase-like hydrolase [Betaproteobacteria bacterium]